jgi:hypothetical protein
MSGQDKLLPDVTRGTTQQANLDILKWGCFPGSARAKYIHRKSSSQRMVFLYKHIHRLQDFSGVPINAGRISAQKSSIGGPVPMPQCVIHGKFRGRKRKGAELGNLVSLSCRWHIYFTTLAVTLAALIALLRAGKNRDRVAFVLIVELFGLNFRQGQTR